MQPCIHCGIVFDINHVPRNPFKRCPNPACGKPLDEDAIAHTFIEANNPSDSKDAQREAGRKLMREDMERTLSAPRTISDVTGTGAAAGAVAVKK